MNEQQRSEALAIAQSLVNLSQSDGWRHYEKAIKALIEQETPRPKGFSPDEATLIASQMSYLSGLQAALDLVESQKQLVKELSKPGLLTKFRKKAS